MAHEFAADLTYRTSPGAAEQTRKISVNHPLTIDGTDVFLISHGYAPHITVRNADGQRRLLRAGGVPARGQHLPLLRGGEGARRRAGRGATQLGLEGEFYPTYGFTKARADRSRPSPTPRTRRSRCSPRRRPRPRRRDAAVGLRAEEEGPGPGHEGRRQAAAARPRAGRTRARCPTASDGHLRRRQPLREAPGQPHPRPEGRARRRGPGADRAARLAVHPAATDLGAGTSRGWAYCSSRSPGSTAAPVGT